MQALSILAAGSSKLIEVPKPTCAEGEVLIRLAFVGFCGSDLSTFQGRNPMVSYPRIPGHELSGTVESFGSQVKGFRLGQNVTVLPYTSCGKCRSCQRGRTNACQFNQTLGVQRDGAMSQWISIPAEKVLPVDGLSLEHLALIEPLTVGFHAVVRAEVTAQDNVLVFGCGMIGLGAISGAARRGASVMAVDISDEKLAVASTLGASHVINSTKANVIDEVMKLTQQHGADVVIEAVGHPTTYRSAVDAAAFAGRIACIGYAKDDVSFTTKLFVQKELNIYGSRNATSQDFKDVLCYLQETPNFPMQLVLTKKVTLAESPDALQKWSDNPGVITKMMVDMR
jgi:L-galactonate 5-dehydrogenase